MPRPAWLAVGAAAGALALASVPAAAVALFGVALAAASLATRVVGPSGLRRSMAPLAVGLLAVGLRVALAPAPQSTTSVIPSGEGPWRGVVETVGSPRQGSRPATIRLEGESPVLVAATLPWYPQVVPGDRVDVSGRIRPPPEDDYGAYLAKIGAIGTLRADALELLPPTGSLAATLEGFRRTASAGLDRSIAEPEAGLATGVLIGLRDRVDRDLAAAFTTAGASHVVAISGWNIAIVASTLGALAGGMRRRRRAILTALAIFVYVVFVGPSASVVRAGAMAGVALLARELGRPGTAAAALGWACTILLILDPAYVEDAGFRLSVLATAGILAWGTSLTARLAGPDPGVPRRFVADVLGVSFAAQAATTPVVLLDFGRLSLVAPAVNLIVVPLVPPAMATGALAMVVGMLVPLGLPTLIASIVGLPAWALYAAMVAVVRVGAALPLASLTLDPPFDGIVAAVSLVVIVAAARRGHRVLGWIQVRRHAGGRARVGTPRTRPRQADPRSRATRFAAVGLAGALLGLVLVVAHRPDGVVRVVVLDVGQGDGILVEGGQGGRLVVDGGPDPARLLIALDERLPPWDHRIDVLVLTHPHEDHVAGLALLLSRYRVGRVYEPGMIGPGPGYEAWSEALAAGATRHGRLTTGDRLTIDAIRFRVLWPDPNRVPERPPDGGTSINNVSIVLLGEIPGRRFLLMGDVEEGVDPELIARGLPTVDLLKVAHHGSKTATTQPFLDVVRPRVAIVSAGAGNPYGHPAPSTLERLAASAGTTYRTDTDGTVEVAFDGRAMRVKASGGRPVPTKRPSSATGTGAVTGTGASTVAAAFLCAIPRATPPSAAAAPVVRPPTAPEAVTWRPPAIGRLPEPETGAATTLRYDRRDGNGPRQRSSRLLLGRRRVRPGSGSRRLPGRPEALPRRPTRAVAAGDRTWRARPPPRRDP